MIDALGSPQSVFVLGGTSDIALATVEKWAARGGLRVVLAARPSAQRAEATERLESRGCDVEVLDFDARDAASHPGVVQAARAGGDIDVALVAFGVLGDPERAWQEHDKAVELAEVN
jgi:decaprenylphospho-beta-D-erythro-pentofuranosid-2-ulose 2-reductase